MIADGTIHDFTHVIQTCRQLVLEEQKAAAPSPSFVMVHHADLENHDLESMQRTTGMAARMARRLSALPIVP